MRLIDADALAKRLFMDDEYNNVPDDYYEGIKDAIKAVNNAPTVDPVKHGHWIPHRLFDDYAYHDNEYDRFECSVCGHCEEFEGDYTLDDFVKSYGAHYCMRCGAKMDDAVSE